MQPSSHPTTGVEDPPTEVAVRRLRTKLARRDKRIDGLLRRVSDLESALALQSIRADRLPLDVERAVQRALCNVRMIPMRGMSNERIAEVTLTVKPKA